MRILKNVIRNFKKMDREDREQVLAFVGAIIAIPGLLIVIGQLCQDIVCV